MPDRTLERIRHDLEQLGVASEASHSISRRLARVGRELEPDVFDAVLSGVALAYGMQREEASVGDADTLDEVQRLMSDFATELGKLEEGLETLAAYLLRIRKETGPGPDQTLH